MDNAVILAAGLSSRFNPSGTRRPKALAVVKGEVLIERQIRQLREAGVPEIYVITGFQEEQFRYLKKRFGVKLRFNPDYQTRNNHASIWAARDVLRNSYICSVDNYFSVNPFEPLVADSYYAAVYVNGPTNEWCIRTDADGVIRSVTVGGRDAWVMMGHSFWNEHFSSIFLSILADVWDDPGTRNQYWEDIYLEHVDRLPMKIRKYPADMIREFDTREEIMEFDPEFRGQGTVDK